MTTSRYDRIAAAALTAVYVSSNEPDTIGVELMHEGKTLFDLCVGADGETTIMFDRVAGMEFVLSDLLRVVDRYKGELDQWRAGLAAPGGIWAAEQ